MLSGCPISVNYYKNKKVNTILTFSLTFEKEKKL